MQLTRKLAADLGVLLFSNLNKDIKMITFISYAIYGYALLIAFSIGEVVLNQKSYEENYVNPHNRMLPFSLFRVLRVKVVVLVIALVIAKSLTK
jgi:hypothetical protein